jgi:hypothetical protein
MSQSLKQGRGPIQEEEEEKDPFAESFEPNVNVNRLNEFFAYNRDLEIV